MNQDGTPELDPKNLSTPRQPLTATRRLNPFVLRLEAIFAFVLAAVAIGAFIIAPMLGRHTDQQSAAAAASPSAAPLIPNAGVAPVGESVINATPAPMPTGSAIALGGAPVTTAPTGNAQVPNAAAMSQPRQDQVSTAEHAIETGDGPVSAPPLSRSYTPPPENVAAGGPNGENLPPVGAVPPTSGLTLGAGPPTTTSVPPPDSGPTNSDVMISGGIAPAPRASQAAQIASATGAITPIEAISAKRNAFASASTTSAYHSARLQDPISRYEVFAGTPLRLQLDDAIDTSISPCVVTAHVEYDVHASLKPYGIVIPSLTKIIGRCNTSINTGDSRIEVAWDTMTFPNGQTFDLQGMSSSDTTGAGGLPAAVDNHTGRLIGTTLLTAILGAGAQLAQAPATSILTAPTIGQQAASAAGSAVAQTGNSLIQQQVAIPPTLSVERGRQFIVRLRATLVLDPTGYDDAEVQAAS